MTPRRRVPTYPTNSGATNGRACLKALSPAPGYIATGFFTDPKTHLIALAHRRAGRLVAAQASWISALRVVEQRLTANPNHRVDLRWQATLLALLDRRAEAERVLQVYNELGAQQQEVTFDQIPAYVALGRHDEVISFLEKLLLQAGNSSQSDRFRGWFHQWLRHHPEIDPVRGNPRFQAVLQSLPPETKR